MWSTLLVLFIGATSVQNFGQASRPFRDAFEDVLKTSRVDQIDELNFRLPNDTNPLSYDIWLSTNIHVGEFGFDGRVIILFEVVETTEVLVLNSRLSTIQNISIFGSDNALIEENVEFVQNEILEFLTIRPVQQLVQGQQYSVQIFYNGTILDDHVGFFRASYNDPSGNVVWMACTQFQAMQARHAFPWYSTESDMKRSI